MNAQTHSQPEETGVRLRGKWHQRMALDRHVSWRAGGEAERVYVPTGITDLAEMIAQLPPIEPLLFVGLGSNLLVRDGGFAGTVVLVHPALGKTSLVDKTCVYAEAGVASPKLASFSAGQGLAGVEFLAGVPGTVGGALTMNAGCYGGETWQLVKAVQTVDRSGTLRWRSPEDYEIGYRHVALLDKSTQGGGQEWFVAARFNLWQDERSAVRQRIKAWLEQRANSQPLELPNAGSVFRNPPDDYAARLIEASGLMGKQLGGARVSNRHANFIVNTGQASANDIESLIYEVQAVVKQRFGVLLETEVRIVGEAA